MKVYTGSVGAGFIGIVTDVLKRLLPSEEDALLIDKSQPIQELSDYLTDIGAQSAVVEEGYVDKDFLDDYVSYYARNFQNNGKKCSRVHFFANAYNQKDVEEKIVTPEGEESFSKSYLGFVVIRPLRKTVVGTTCLVPYKQAETGCHYEAGRHYLAVCKKKISFFGIPLEVECTPSQEQDSNVAACATCALWSAFNVSAELFGNKVLSPSAITTLAMENSFSGFRKFPNHGLPLGEMLYAIRKMGLEPVVVNFDGFVGQTHKFLGNVYAYLNLGISVIAIVDAVDGKRCEERPRGLHAIVINGYHVSKSNDVEVLFAARIDKIYANDDQRVPGERFRIDWKRKGKGNDKEKFELVACSGPSADSHDYRRLVPKYLIIPSYHKIRVSYDEIWEDAFLCDQALQTVVLNRIRTIENPCAGPAGLQWDITLSECTKVKNQIRKDRGFSPKDKLLFVEEPMPRFLWCLRILLDGKEVSVIYVDATDSGQGIRVVSRVICDIEIQEIARKTFEWNKGAIESVIFKTLLS